MTPTQAPASDLERQHSRLVKIFAFVARSAHAGDYAPADAVWDLAVDALERHMRAEDVLLSDLRPTTTAQDERIAALRADHVVIAKMIQELGVVLQLHAASPGALYDLVALLEAHAHREEGSVYRWLEAPPSREEEAPSARFPGAALGAAVGTVGGVLAGPAGAVGGAAFGAALGALVGEALDHLGQPKSEAEAAGSGERPDAEGTSAAYRRRNIALDELATSLWSVRPLAPPAAVAASTILVVDDNVENGELARETLQDEGYRVVLAENGAEALARFAEQPADCVLLDVRMPGQDGFAVCASLRAMPLGAHLPIIFLTGLRDVDTFDRAALAGGDDFLTKPIRPAELVLRVRTALKLRRVSVELSGAVDALKQQRDALQRARLAAERLTAYVVHDLNNPVNIIDLHAQLLQGDPELSASALGSVAEIRSATRRLVRMIANLLDVSRADEGKLSLRRRAVPAAPLLDDVRKEMDASARAVAVELRIAVSVANVSGDAELLRRTVANLVENALRYAPPRSVVVMSAATAEGGVDVCISDAGRGVPEEQREAIFEPFLQLTPQAAASRGGRGLGLAFCKLVAEAHGGRLSVEDAEPGARFRLYLPDPPDEAG